MVASQYGFLECIEVLLSQATFACMGVKNVEGETAESLAFENGHTQVEALIKSWSLFLKESQEIQMELRSPCKKVKSISI